MRLERVLRLSTLLASLAAPWPAGAATCAGPSSTVSREALARFASSPRTLLDEHPAGGVPLQGALANLATASAAMMRPVEEVARHASPRQSEAVGAALAQAFRLCRGRDDALASMIRRSALSSPNGAVRRAFLDRTDFDDPAAKPARRTEGGKRSPIRLNPDGGKLPDPFAPVRID